MPGNPIFVGRKKETEAFTRWVASDCENIADKRAALIVGSPGMGKTALVNRLERLCLAHAPPRAPSFGPR